MGKNNKSTLSGKICREIFIVSLIAGFSGFMLGLLFAPQSGRKSRKFLAEQLREIIDRGKFAIIEARVMAEELLEKNRNKDSEKFQA